MRMSDLIRVRLGASLSTLAVSLLLATFAAPVHAGTYRNVDCDCDPVTEGREIPKIDDESHYSFDAKHGCICSESYTFYTLETKEFRFRCKHTDTAWPIPFYQNVFDRDKPMTCTISYEALSYGSVSCTNWSTLSKDTVKLQTLCTTIEEGFANDQ